MWPLLGSEFPGASGQDGGGGGRVAWDVFHFPGGNVNFPLQAGCSLGDCNPTSRCSWGSLLAVHGLLDAGRTCPPSCGPQLCPLRLGALPPAGLQPLAAFEASLGPLALRRAVFGHSWQPFPAWSWYLCFTSWSQLTASVQECSTWIPVRWSSSLGALVDTSYRET